MTPRRRSIGLVRSRRALAVATTLATIGVTAPSVADAATGDLHVYSGSLPDGPPVTVGPWVNLNTNSPGGVGSYGLAAGDVPEGWTTTATLSPPPDLSFASATILRLLDAPVSHNNSQPQIESSWENRGWPHTGTNGYGGYPGDSAAGTVSVSNPASLWMRASCVKANAATGSCTHGMSLFIQRLDLVLRDTDPPTATGSMTSELLDGTWKTGRTGEVRVTAADVGSGVYRAWIREGAVTTYANIDPSSSRCRDAIPANGNPYEFIASALTLVPCRTASAEYTPTFDLTALGDGVHTVSLGIEDAGGNERTLLTNRTLRINAPGGTLPDAGTTGPGGCIWEADGTTCTSPSGGGGGGGGGGTPSGGGSAGGVTPVPSPGPAAAPTAPAAIAAEAPAPAQRPCNGDRCTTTARITVKAGRGGSQTVAVAYGARARIRGRLLTPDGEPIAGAIMDVTAVTDGRDARTAARTTVRTDAAGEFVYTAPAGLSGDVTFSYRTHLDGTAEAARYEVRVRVIAGVRLSVNRSRVRNKQSVAFSGRILGSPAGYRKIVELQARSGGRWVTFATTRTRGGRYGYRYRFERTFSRQTYGFRAVVRNETGWPYLTGYSNRVYVTVRP